MNRLSLLLIAPVLALAACTGGKEDAAGSNGGLVEAVVREIRDEVANENLSLGKGKDGQPRAEITPAGDLLIGGEAVPLTEAQREKVLAYRGELAGVAEAGAAIGLRSAELAKDAAAEAIAGAIRGDAKETVEARIKADAEGIEEAARALCDGLPRLYAAQQALVEAVPAFAPYAEMDPSDIDDCRVN